MISLKYLKQILILIIFIIARLSACSAMISEQEDCLEMGNTNGNIKQMGYAVESDGWIYYNGFGGAQGDCDQSLSKKRVDDTEIQKLSNRLAYQINVVGDYVYYINEEPGPIYKTNKNNGVTTKLESRRCSNLIVVGHTIFFRREYQDLYKMNCDGKFKTKIVSDILEFSVYEKMIYYTSITDKCMYRVDFNGKNKEKVSDSYAMEINIENDRIYYIDFDDSNLYTLKLDGSDKKVLDTGRCSNLNLYQGVLYYCYLDNNKFPLQPYLVRMNVDGSNKVRLIAGNIVNINVLNDFIVYRQVTEKAGLEAGLYKIDLDGKNQVKWE